VKTVLTELKMQRAIDYAAQLKLEDNKGRVLTGKNKGNKYWEADVQAKKLKTQARARQAEIKVKKEEEKQRRKLEKEVGGHFDADVIRAATTTIKPGAAGAGGAGANGVSFAASTVGGASSAAGGKGAGAAGGAKGKLGKAGQRANDSNSSATDEEDDREEEVEPEEHKTEEQLQEEIDARNGPPRFMDHPGMADVVRFLPTCCFFDEAPNPVRVGMSDLEALYQICHRKPEDIIGLLLYSHSNHYKFNSFSDLSTEVSFLQLHFDVEGELPEPKAQGDIDGASRRESVLDMAHSRSRSLSLSQTGDKLLSRAGEAGKAGLMEPAISEE
jgi:hypothetical protein